MTGRNSFIIAFIAVLAYMSLCSAAALPEESAATAKERAALLAYLQSKGVELRPAPNRSNVISHMYSIGPDHGKQYLVGLTYHARTQTWADVTGNKAIAIPFAPVNRHWVLWRVGGPGGNASQEFQTAWEKTLDALRGYEERT
jgi:hypothetical protein